VIGLPHVLAVGLLVTQLSGCSLLDLLFGVEPPFDPDDPFPFPTAEATFTTGTATIELENETIVLDELLANSNLTEFGFSVARENDDGWYLTFSGFPEDPFAPEGGYLSMHRIVDNEHLVILDSTRCVTTTDQADADGIVGSATCRGLRWSDYFSTNPIGLPEPNSSEPPFDAEITFEAR
jgi:hypothetical protein